MLERFSPMSRPIRIVDVCTVKPLAGNQLAVVLDGKDLSAKTMQRIAQEMNFSETTFVLPPEDSKHAAKVRIFTPAAELPFAGHPTIGTAWVLADEGLVSGDATDFTLEENVGPVKVRSVKEHGRVLFWMTHPPLTFGPVFPHKEVASAIGVEESAIVHDVPAQVASTGAPFLFVALRDAGAVDSAVSTRHGCANFCTAIAVMVCSCSRPPVKAGSTAACSPSTSRKILRPARPAVHSARSRSSTAWSSARLKSQSSVSRGRRWAARASCTSSSRTASRRTPRSASRSAAASCPC